MKTISYFLTLITATYLGKSFIGIASVYIWVYILSNFGTPPSLVSTTVAYISYILSWIFALFLIFRIYLCIDKKQLLIPEEYSGAIYIVGATIITLFALAILVTFVSAFGFLNGLSGVPVGLTLVPAGLVSMFITLRCEVPSIRKFFNNRTSI